MECGASPIRGVGLRAWPDLADPAGSGGRTTCSLRWLRGRSKPGPAASGAFRIHPEGPSPPWVDPAAAAAAADGPPVAASAAGASTASGTIRKGSLPSQRRCSSALASWRGAYHVP